MTSSTPSPSEQELADLLNALDHYGEFGIVRSCITMEHARLAATLLRRLAETERERDEAKQALEIAEGTLTVRANDIKMLEEQRDRWYAAALQRAGVEDKLKAAEAERDALRDRLAETERHVEQLHAKMTCMCGSEMNHSPWEGHTSVSMYDYALDQMTERAVAAEAERDALREMLAQADEVIAFGRWLFEGRSLPDDITANFRQALARHRQRLSSPSTPATPDSKRDE